MCSCKINWEQFAGDGRHYCELVGDVWVRNNMIHAGFTAFISLPIEMEKLHWKITSKVKPRSINHQSVQFLSGGLHYPTHKLCSSVELVCLFGLLNAAFKFIFSVLMKGGGCRF